MVTKAPIAFLLVKFQGSSAEPITVGYAEKMFTITGRGTMNVVDWFDDNTHGQIDMGGNKVFGWLGLSETVASYQAKRADGTYGRSKIVDLGRAAAVAAGVDLSGFTAVVVVTNVEVDLFGGVGSVCCTAVTAGKQFWENQVAPSVLCQEMIHGLGAYDHARRDGSDADYTDPYDVMSMFNAIPGRLPADPNVPVGPGLNAAFMKRCGWLDPTRAAAAGQVGLRPLHRRDLSGPLYVVVGEYYVEYRASQRWDTGFSSVVLVHYVANNTSYLVAELGAGATFEWGARSPFQTSGSVTVDAIDDASETATVSSVVREPRPIPVLTATSIFQSEFVDAGGLVIFGGKIIRIPPRSPAFGLLEAAAGLASLNEVQLAPAISTAARAEIYGRALEQITEAHEHVTGVSSPFDHINMKDARRFHERVAKRVL
jgi:hypothetical protein